MDKITHAARLKTLFDEFIIITQKDGFKKNKSLLIQSVDNEELDLWWISAQSCISQIECIFKENGKFTERTSIAMSKPIQRVQLALSNKAFLKDYINYSSHHLGQKLYDDLDLIDALLDEKEVFESFTEETIPEIVKQINELKENISEAEISNNLKKPLLSLLCRMQEIFEQYNLYGEQELEIISQRFAGTLVKYNKDLSKNDEIKDQSLSLLGGLWKSYVFSGENIARINALQSVLPG